MVRKNAFLVNKLLVIEQLSANYLRPKQQFTAIIVMN